MRIDLGEESHSGPYIIDACTVIDYQKTEDRVLGLFSRNFGPVYVARPVLDEEIRGFSSEDCTRLGIAIAQPEATQIIEAGKRHGSISVYDALTLIMARDNGWTIISGDKALSRQAAVEHVECIRGLRPMIMLVSSGHLSGNAAMEVAERMRTINPGFLSRKILEEFRREIRKATVDTTRDK